MRVCIISDGKQTTDLSIELKNTVTDHFTDKGYEVVHHALQPEDVGNCIGCFGCWIKNLVNV